MSRQYDEGGPAFPTTPLETIVSKDRDGDTVLKNYGCGSGMTLRQYAAIKLCVPDSGLPWLDEMIVKSRRFNIDDATLAMAKMNVAILEAREAK